MLAIKAKGQPSHALPEATLRFPTKYIKMARCLATALLESTSSLLPISVTVANTGAFLLTILAKVQRLSSTLLFMVSVYVAMARNASTSRAWVGTWELDYLKR